MSSNFTVIYDACVLYPAPLRDLLMRLALTDLYRARWTDMIHDEWTRNVLKQRPDLKAEDLQRTRSLMNSHVRDSLVTGFEHLIPSDELPDADRGDAALRGQRGMLLLSQHQPCGDHRHDADGGCADQGRPAQSERSAPRGFNTGHIEYSLNAKPLDLSGTVGP